jgi:hypothetical protein
MALAAWRCGPSRLTKTPQLALAGVEELPAALGGIVDGGR